MDDDEIVELFLKKDESAIIHTAEKYGCRLRSISQRITADILTAEECEMIHTSKHGIEFHQMNPERIL